MPTLRMDHFILDDFNNMKKLIIGSYIYISYIWMITLILDSLHAASDCIRFADLMSKHLRTSAVFMDTEGAK
jgi:hypothetical protein